MRKLFVLLSIGLGALNTQAQEKVQIHTDKKMKMYIYPESIDNGNYGYHTVWTAMVFHKPEKINYQSVAMTENWFLVDCGKKRFSLIASKIYNKNGEEIAYDGVGEYRAKNNLAPATKGYSSYKVVEYVCKHIK